MTGAAGQPVRLFAMARGPHWTLIGYQTDRGASPAARLNLHIHRIGPDGDVHDSGGHFAAAYGVKAGDWVLVRPDGYVGGIFGFSADQRDSLSKFIDRVGLTSPSTLQTTTPGPAIVVPAL